MPNSTVAIALLSLGGACIYVYAMSVLGRLLATCRESCSAAATVAPATQMLPA